MLERILQFVIGAGEEPVLGFGVPPCIQFIKTSETSKWAFVPQANTCLNILFLPMRSQLLPALPAEEELYKIHDYAFANAYFGHR